ncbi:MAG: hypothetical protein U1A04_00205, partial [Moraxellaceae bacterium]|nr:hypothetical protein [Moraxellaceae bacterium]
MPMPADRSTVVDSYARRLLRKSVVLPVLAAALSLAPISYADAPTLQPTDVQSKVARLITRQLAVLHYNRTPVNDELSEEILKRYLNNLDGQRLYFLAEDIQAFNRWKTQIDDQLRAGLMGPAFTIHNRYQQRLRERLSFALTEIANGKAILDFDKDDSIINDRKEEA